MSQDDSREGKAHWDSVHTAFQYKSKAVACSSGKRAGGEESKEKAARPSMSHSLKQIHFKAETRRIQFAEKRNDRTSPKHGWGNNDRGYGETVKIPQVSIRQPEALERQKANWTSVGKSKKAGPDVHTNQ